MYDLIYANLEMVPGYERYAQYAEAVLKEPDPLGYLANCEDVYWAVEQYLQQKICMSNNPKYRILEVGSGLGYLTYAIARRGYDVIGLDVSAEAVRRAIERYGEMFVCANLADYSEAHKSSLYYNTH